MSKYNPGDEFIIRIGSEYVYEEGDSKDIFCEIPDKLYRIEGFKSLVFDESGLDRLQSISKRGAEISIEGQNAGYRKGTEETRNLILHVLQMSPQVRQHIFGYFTTGDILTHFGVDEISNRCNSYDLEKSFAPGDEIESRDGKFIVMKAFEASGDYLVYNPRTNGFDTATCPEDYNKTGRHFMQVDEMFEAFQRVKALDDRIAEGAPVDKEVQ